MASSATSTVRAERPAIVGPATGPEPPFPLRLEGEVVKGFGRGSKELGIPTANIPISGLSVGGRTDIESGIYFGYAGLRAPALIHRTSSLPAGAATSTASKSAKGSEGTSTIDPPTADAADAAATTTAKEEAKGETSVDHDAVAYPMVMSVGWNPFYKNEKRSVEIHLIHDFAHDFYGAHIRLSILGFVRPELDYTSKEALIEDIRTDIRVTTASLEREPWRRYRTEKWLVGEDED